MSEITPPVCPACGLDEADCEEEGFEDGFMEFPIPNAGVAHFVCPRCFAVMMNKECFEAQREKREQGESRIIRVAGA